MFRTYEPAHDRLVAVKAFRLDVTPEHARALARELQRVADAGLDHPSIVRVIGAGFEGALAYSASEYVAAESLDIAVRHYAPAGLEKVLPFITQLAGAIDFARAAGIGHGALHPRDIFVTPDEACASGFGVVQALEATGIRAPVRRPYSAPERVDGGAWDITADVYSLAAIAFELLTGRRPVGADVGAIGSNAGPHAEEIAQAISRALAENPAHRYPSALAFAAALEASSRGERTTAAIEEVRAVSEGSVASVTHAPEPVGDDVRDLRFEPADADAEVEPADIVAERESDSEFEGPTFDSDQLREDAEDRSLFDLDREGEDGIPEVQHSGFQPGVLDPGYQSEPPPPEGWDQPVPLPPADGARVSERDEDWEFGPTRSSDERRAVDTAHPDASASAPRRTAPSRGRSVVLPVAITMLLGLFVGFLAGYLVFVRDGSKTAGPATEPAGAASPQASSAQPAERAPQRGATTPGPTSSAKPAPATPAAPENRTSTARSRTSAAAPTTPARGRLVVRSTPSGAQVFVNGRRRGTTPLALRDLAPGSYNVRLSREGYADTSRRVSVGGSTVREIAVRLARQAPAKAPAFSGSLYVDSRPRGARVVLDGKEVGTTPVQLSDVRAGAHVIRLELTDHRTWTTSARVVAGEVARVTGSLERLR